MHAVGVEKQSLLRWCVWFFLGHVILFWLIGLVYWPAIPRIYANYTVNFLVFLSYLSHLAILAISPCLIILPLILVLPWRRTIFIFSIVIATGASSLLFIDTLVYNLYQFHLNGALLALAYYGITKGVLGLSLFEKICSPFIIAVFLLGEWFYGKWLWSRLQNSLFLAGQLKWVGSGLVVVGCAAFIFVVLNANQIIMRILIEKTRFLPLYVEVLSVVLPKSDGNYPLIRIHSKNPQQWVSVTHKLHYPINPLQYATQHSLMNLLIITIDTWRYDMLNEQVTPHIKKFAQQSWVFDNHYSGGNSTLPGIFTLFYGLPATYISAMETQHRTPALLDALEEKGYQIGIFSSAPLSIPPMDRSVFQGIKNLDIEKSAESVYERDQLITNKFSQFIQNRNIDKPFFSFLFFDAAHSYCGSDEMSGPFYPTAESCNRMTFSRKRDFESYFNRYKNALYFIDQQIKQVLQVLETNHLLDNTVVMIVGDHGEEFDDAGHGYYGHASNFSRYQVQTPLIVYWPKENPQVLTHQTSHFDIVPTLMSKFLGCQNQYTDYSVGNNLLNQAERPYFIISSYVDFGVIEPEKITTIDSTGNYRVERLNGDMLPGESFNRKLMQDVYGELHRFYEAG